MCKVYSSYYESPLGQMLLAAQGDFLLGVWFVGQQHCGQPGELTEKHPVLEQGKSWLNRYFAGEMPEISELPVKLQGTAFQRSVWEELKKIPYGETVTYADIASRTGKGSARAVGSAVGRNPVSIIIPCHRVIGSGGCLVGYAGGLERKAYLLKLEMKV